MPHLFLTLALGLLYILASSGLIAFNKYLMNEHRYPFAIALVMGHMLSCFLLSLLLYCWCPSLFPSLQGQSRAEVAGKVQKGMKVLVPMSIFFAGTLVLSNQAYLYCSLAFLQMMKEGNLILVYAMSLALRLEKFNGTTMQILLFITFATTLTLYGEIRFVLLGFVIQLGSQLCETSKLALQNLFLVGDGLKFDPLSFVLLMSPLCFTVLFIKLYFLQWHAAVGVAFLVWWPLLLVNAIVAFSLNVVIAFFIKSSSAVAFIIAGIVKDIAIVMCSAVIFREHISLLQAVGFILQLSGIFVYSLMRTFPADFQDGVLYGISRVYAGFTPPATTAKVDDYGTIAQENPKQRV